MMPKKKKTKTQHNFEKQIDNKQKFMIFIIYDFTKKVPATEQQKIG